MIVDRSRFVFSGSGGQGVITAAIILAEAAVLHENLNAVQTQSYGAAARGGTTRSDVIISDSEIYFPKVIQPNVLVCLTQESYNKYHRMIRPGGLLINDNRYVRSARGVDALQKDLPIFKTVMERIGKPVVFNICMLGAVLGLTGIVRPESIIEVLKTRIPAEAIEMNRQALDLGLELGTAVA